MKTDMRKIRRRLFPYLSPKMLKLLHRAGLLTYEPDTASSHSERTVTLSNVGFLSRLQQRDCYRITRYSLFILPKKKPDEENKISQKESEIDESRSY